MLKKIDRLGRVDIPKAFRKELGIGLDEYIEINKTGDEIIIKKMNNMLSQEAIQYMFDSWKKQNTDSDFDRGYGEALRIILGEEN